MAFVRWLAGGFIGGLIGAAIWAAIGYATQYEIGWIAWGVGFLVGMGVRMAAPDTDGPAPGAVAVVIAILSILIGKYAMAHLVVSSAMGQVSFQPPPPDTETMIALTADTVEEEFKQAKRRMTPAKMPFDSPNEKPDVEVPLEHRYPKEVWAEATKRWNALPADQKEQQTKAREEQVKEMVAAFSGQLHSSARGEVFANSFGPFDALWFILASLTAFRMGSGAVSDE